ncbi:MAG: autotransporter domain-containing protein [Agrobacterium tumefaciens]|jgi:hypothetical protein
MGYEPATCRSATVPHCYSYSLGKKRRFGFGLPWPGADCPMPGSRKPEPTFKRLAAWSSSVQSWQFRYGVDARLPINDQLRLVGTVEGVHRFENRGSNVTGQVIGLGGFSLQGSAYQKDWLRAGAGIELDIAGSTLSVMGNATTKGESSSAWLAANWRVTF